jgi:hypothetical protein
MQVELADHDVERRYGEIFILAAACGLIALLLMTAVKRLRMPGARTDKSDKQALCQGVSHQHKIFDQESHSAYVGLSQAPWQPGLGIAKETHRPDIRLSQTTHQPYSGLTQKETLTTKQLYPTLSQEICQFIKSYSTQTQPFHGMSQDVSHSCLGQGEEICHSDEESEHVDFEDEMADPYCRHGAGQPYLAQNKEIEDCCPGPVTEDDQAISDFASGLRDSYPIHETSSDLLLLRVDTDFVDKGLVNTKQRRYSNWDNGFTHKNIYKVFTRASRLFGNVFSGQNYIDIE